MGVSFNSEKHNGVFVNYPLSFFSFLIFGRMTATSRLQWWAPSTVPRASFHSPSSYSQRLVGKENELSKFMKSQHGSTFYYYSWTITLGHFSKSVQNTALFELV